MSGSDRGIASFGPFRLSPSRREIERDGNSLVMGDRALDILIVLVENAGEIVSHRDLISRVWRGLVVSPGNLRVHMTSLRKALGDGEAGARYIENVTGQGYCFVAPVSHTNLADATEPAPSSPTITQSRALPPPLARMVGRDDTVRTIAADLRADRFVTIVGPGGMGKTTVAVSVAHAMLEEFASKACFVDIGAIADPKLLAATVASTLGLTIQSEDVVTTLLALLRTTRMLLVLDNCEHIIDATASLAETIFSQAPEVHILATSREALRVEGEHAHWLRPLESPPPDTSVSAATALMFPAVKLFVERAMASNSRFELTDVNAPLVADICGRLDGIALALELVAGRVGAYGLKGTADLLNKRLGLHWQGRRTALPRHQTLHGLLDWSYSLLPDSERRVLRRLSIFVGTLTLDAAQAVASEAELDDVQLANTLDHLIAKSLVSVIKNHEGATCYRLLETTRVYASEKLLESGEASAVAERHARHFTRLLHDTFGRHSEPHHDMGVRCSVEHLGNVRAALAWCFDETNERPDPESLSRMPARRIRLGIELTAASVPVFLELSLLNECHRWSKVALTLLDDATRGSRCELVLLEAWAISSTWTRGNGDDVRAALTRGLALAMELGDEPCRMRLLVGMHVFLMRVGEFRGSLAIAEDLQSAAHSHADASYAILSDWMRGSSEHFTGNQAAARDYFERGFARVGPRNMQLFGLDYRVRALVTFARVLWLNGSPDRAMEVAREAVREATQGGKPLNVCFSLLYSAPVLLWCGDTDGTRDGLDKLMAHPNWRALPSLHATGMALQGELLVRLGDADSGTQLLSEALRSMRADRQNILVARAACGLAEGLAASGRLGEALSVISEAIAHTTDNGEVLELPELLRIKATVLLSAPEQQSSEAEDCLTQSLACARRQGAKGWELRTTTTLARLRSAQRRDAEARDLLATIYTQFAEGFETHDLKAAGVLLRELDRTQDSGSTAVAVEDLVFGSPASATYLKFNPPADSGGVARGIE